MEGVHADRLPLSDVNRFETDGAFQLGQVRVRPIPRVENLHQLGSQHVQPQESAQFSKGSHRPFVGQPLVDPGQAVLPVEGLEDGFSVLCVLGALLLQDLVAIVVSVDGPVDHPIDEVEILVGDLEVVFDELGDALESIPFLRDFDDLGRLRMTQHVAGHQHEIRKRL